VENMKKSSFRWEYRYTVLVLCWFGWITIYLSKSIIESLLPVISIELNLSHAQGGMLETFYLVGYILIKIPSGVLAKRIGIKRTLVLGMLGYASATALSLFAGNFLYLIVLRFLVGLFQGIHLPLANTLLSERFGAKQGRAIGFHESGPNVGSAIAFPLAVTIASAYNWRYAFLFLSVPAFIAAGFVSILVKEEKNRGVLSPNEHKYSKRLREYIRLLVPLALAHATYNMCFRTLLTFASSFLVEYRGLSLVTAVRVAMLLPAAGIFAKLSSGFLAERLKRKNLICIAIFLSGFLIFLLTKLSGELAISFNFVFLGLVLYSFSPVIYSSITFGFPSELKSIGLGVVTMIGNIFGAFSTSFIGYLIDIRGYSITLVNLAMVVIGASVVNYIIWED
jgi:predicted MFS family arabinose efflux permease